MTDNKRAEIDAELKGWPQKSTALVGRNLNPPLAPASPAAIKAEFRHTAALREIQHP
jgi:hypothetical protein